jgi:hypothetical protein
MGSQETIFLVDHKLEVAGIL